MIDQGIDIRGNMPPVGHLDRDKYRHEDDDRRPRPPRGGYGAMPFSSIRREPSAKMSHQNPVLGKGEPVYEFDTRRLKIGDGRTKYNGLPYVVDGRNIKDGKSAYQIWLDQGYNGTVNDFLEFLTGKPGASAYELWLAVGNEGTIEDFLVAIQGESAYEVWISAGNTGSVQDYLQSLVGASAYDIWVSSGNTGTKQDFLDSLKGDSAYEVWLKAGNEGTVEDYLDSLCTTTWGKF